MSRKNCPWYTFVPLLQSSDPKGIAATNSFLQRERARETSIPGQICASLLPFPLSHHPIHGGVKISVGSVHKWMVVKTPEWPQWQPWRPSCHQLQASLSWCVLQEVGRPNCFRSLSIDLLSAERLLPLTVFYKIHQKRTTNIVWVTFTAQSVGQGVIFSTFCVYI